MKLIPKSGCLTLDEIRQQPSIWNSILVDILDKEEKYRNFLTPLFAIPNLEIVLTGTGSSAYIGDTLEPYLKDKFHHKVRSIPTSDIISNPYDSLNKDNPTLVITYSRSGNTPETNYCHRIINNYITTVYNLVITCTDNSTLYTMCQSESNTLIVTLPEAANDKALAMTSGYTSMIFSTILLSELDNLSFITSNLHFVLSYSKELLSSLWSKIYGIVQSNPDRIIFLGTDELSGLSNYCALNILKLTNRKVYSLSLNPKFLANDIFPFIDENSLVVLFHSNKTTNLEYERTFLNGLKNVNKNCTICIVSEAPVNITSNVEEFILSSESNLSDCFSSMCFAFFGQILAYLYSLHLKLKVDNP